MSILSHLLGRPKPLFSDPEVAAQAVRIREAWATAHAEAVKGEAMGLYITMRCDGLGDPNQQLTRFKPALRIQRWENL